MPPFADHRRIVFRDLECLSLSVIEQRSWQRRVVARDRHALDVLAPIVRRPDRLFEIEGAHLLHMAAVQQIARFEADGQALVLKRYVATTRARRLRRAMTTSRAARSWHAAHRLLEIGVGTPRPWLMLEQRFGPLRGRAWLVTDFCPGMHVDEAYRLGGRNERDAIETSLARLFELMLSHRISHRDTKPANLLWTKDGQLQVIDLDSVRYHWTRAGAVRGSLRDRRIFLDYWRDEPALQQQFARRLATA
ncbi:MAG TPA: lipopolysaccharide kinase InaA family protein [Burkholderiaceae bacterium]|nr:lipopolysaccharide kinase InaA family protein [Burkholderiaceae bacterium]